MASPSKSAVDEFYLAFLRDVARRQEHVQAVALQAALRRVESPKLWHLLTLLGPDAVDLTAFPGLGKLRIGELLGRDEPGLTLDELLSELGLSGDALLDDARCRPGLLDREL